MIVEKAAAIDLGTNTARLLIGCIEPDGSLRQLLLKRHITRLGGGFSKDQGISREATERTVAALQDFAADISFHDISVVRAVATSAVRDAVNREVFCAEIFSRTGIRLEVIDGEAEGILTLTGVLAGLDCSTDDLLLFDVGGGSTEYILTRGGKILFSDSLPLGVVRLTEGKITCSAMESKIDRELAALKKAMTADNLLPFPEITTLVGTAGTATTLAAISMKMADYDYRRVNNHTLTLDEIRDIFSLLLPLGLDERLRIPGLERGREDLIVAGILITIRTMETFGFTHLKVSDYGLLDGVLRETFTNTKAHAGSLGKCGTT